jgi:hypothetical protein
MSMMIWIGGKCGHWVHTTNKALWESLPHVVKIAAVGCVAAPLMLSGDHAKAADTSPFNTPPIVMHAPPSIPQSPPLGDLGDIGPLLIPGLGQMQYQTPESMLQEAGFNNDYFETSNSSNSSKSFVPSPPPNHAGQICDNVVKCPEPETYGIFTLATIIVTWLRLKRKKNG